MSAKVLPFPASRVVRVPPLPEPAQVAAMRRVLDDILNGPAPPKPRAKRRKP